MKHRSLLPTLLLLTSSLGCAAQLRAQGSPGGAQVSAQVRGDARAVAAAGVLAAGISALAAGASEDSQPRPQAAVHTGDVTATAARSRTESGATVTGVEVTLRGVALIDDATGVTIRRVEGGSARFDIGGGALAGASITGGALRVRARGAMDAWTVSSGALRVSTGRTVQVREGALQVSARDDGTCVATGGTISLSTGASVVEAPAPAVRVGASVDATLVRARLGGDANVLGGGRVHLDGAPDLADLRLIDGALDAQAQGAVGVEGRWTVRGGAVLLEDGHGRRWRCRVEGGELVARTEGANPQGRTIWTPSRASLRISVSVQGDARLALTGDSPSVPLMTSPVALPGRVMAALDALITAAPEGSVESMRLASAVQVAIRQAESADPALYAVPVRGRSVVLLVDVSYSMRDVDPAAIWFDLGREARPTKLDVARAELVKVLASLPEGTTANVVAFSSAARALWTAPQAIDATRLDEAIRWLAALRPADETHPATAVELAATMQPEQIIMVSDGRPSDDATCGRELLGFVQGISVRTRLDVVGVGPDQDREFLAALALSGRGSLRQR